MRIIDKIIREGRPQELESKELIDHLWFSDDLPYNELSSSLFISQEEANALISNVINYVNEVDSDHTITIDSLPVLQKDE